MQTGTTPYRGQFENPWQDYKCNLPSDPSISHLTIYPTNMTIPIKNDTQIRLFMEAVSSSTGMGKKDPAAHD